MNQKHLMYAAIAASAISMCSVHAMRPQAMTVSRVTESISRAVPTGAIRSMYVAGGHKNAALANASIADSACKIMWSIAAKVGAKAAAWGTSKAAAHEYAWRHGELPEQRAYGIEEWCKMNGVDPKEIVRGTVEHREQETGIVVDEGGDKKA